MSKDSEVGVKGVYHFERLDCDGRVVEERTVTNVFTNTGKSEHALLVTGGGTSFSHVAIGTGTNAESAGDTSLQTETDRQSATTNTVTTNVSGDTAEFVASFSFNSGVSITEAGLFNNSSGGTMTSRVVFSALNFNNGDSLNVTLNLIYQ